MMRFLVDLTIQCKTHHGCGSIARNTVSLLLDSIAYTFNYFLSRVGFYQRGDPTDPRSIETSFLSLDLFQAQCNTRFAGPDAVPLEQPDVEKVNKYGGWDMNPANVFWTNGECE